MDPEFTKTIRVTVPPGDEEKAHTATSEDVPPAKRKEVPEEPASPTVLVGSPTQSPDE